MNIDHPSFYVCWTLYAAGVNLWAAFLMAADKHRAVKGKWRIRESRLWVAALMGGAAGIWAGMAAFRHKTRRPLFRVAIPVLFVLQLTVFIGMMRIAAFP